MVLHRPDQVTSLRHLPSWALLAFGAGAVNAGALLACQRFVSHVTGTVTHIGVDVGKDAEVLALDYLLVLACFVAGATAAVLLVRRSTASSSAPRYWFPLLVVTAILVVIALGGQAGLFGVFGGSTEAAHDFAFLAVLSFAMGMQNAAVATSTGMAVRTTHMTGPATDLGVAFATLIDGAPRERADARRSIALRATKLFSFMAGAGVMVPLALRLEFMAFLVPAVACTAATVSSFVPSMLETPDAA